MGYVEAQIERVSRCQLANAGLSCDGPAVWRINKDSFMALYLLESKSLGYVLCIIDSSSAISVDVASAVELLGWTD